MKTVTIDFHGKSLSVEVGRMAKQANGAAYIQYGDTSLLVTAVASRKDRIGANFLPLTVDYFEKFASAGKIPGGFFKREGRQTEKEVLTSRLCDRPIRPLFPDGYARDTQITATVMSFDGENDSDVLALLGASTALHVSDMPFMGPIAAVRVGRIGGNLVCNPTMTEREKSDLDIIVAGSRDAIVMVEGETNELPEPEVLDALMFGFDSLQPLLDLQDELQKELGQPKFTVEAKVEDTAMVEKVRSTAESRITETLKIVEKMPRYRQLSDQKEEIIREICATGSEWEGKEGDVAEALGKIVKGKIRGQVVSEKKRLDNRVSTDIRTITCETGVLPRTHGSALFTRGETQAIVTTTLGTSDDEQRMDLLHGEARRHFMLHYNFPAFSVGEVKPNRGPGRREIGHGALAHRSLEKILPTREDFPYAIRVVSDILESHGSSSMATVCGGALSMMDAGVPIKAPVAGIAMGLIKENDEFIILSDISGDEDHIGDMDFKIAGTAKGITGIQMDIKVRGLGRDILEKALMQAREGLNHILGKMEESLQRPREELSPYAPRIETIQVKQDKIREIIGPGGKMIRSIVEQSGAKVDIDDSGKVSIASADLKALQKARDMIEAISAEAEVGKIYKGKVRRVMEYGAFVEIMPGTDGLVHISELHSKDGRVERVEDHVEEGDEIEVKVINVDHQGKIKLSQREVIEPGSSNFKPDSSDRGDRGGFRSGGRDRGPRGGGDRGGDRNRSSSGGGRGDRNRGSSGSSSGGERERKYRD